MNLSIQDGRVELWQWDTGVRLVMDEACEAVNLSEDTFGVTVDVTAAEDGKTWVAAVPDEMLQKPGDLICYAVQSTATGTITAAYRSFRVNRRPKPAGYVATPTEARTWQELNDKKIDAPQVAQVGEVLTVEEVNEDGKPKKWKTAPAAAEQVQADYTQNDPSAANYIKNRPGRYYGDPVTVDEEIYSGKIEQALAEMLVDWLLVAGQTYKVTIGEVTKTYTAFADSFSGFSGVTIGDGTIEDAAKSGEMFALFSAENKGDKAALLVCTVADVGKTIRVTTETQKREVHKIPTELLDLGGVDESINQTNAALDALYGDISSINKTLTEGPITFKRGNKTLELGKYDAYNGLILRWDNVNGGYTMLSQSGLVAKYSDVEFFMTVFNVSLIEKTHDSGIHFNLEKSDNNGGTRFILDNVAGDKTTFYASGKIINSNKLLQLSANDTITEDNATTLRGVKTPEQEYDAANKKYVDQRLPSPPLHK